MKVEFYKDKKKQHRWRVKAGNGKIIATSSESYKRKQACEKAFNRLVDFCHVYARAEEINIPPKNPLVITKSKKDEFVNL